MPVPHHSISVCTGTRVPEKTTAPLMTFSDRVTTMPRREIGLTIFSLIFQLSAENMRWLC
jgi:hypothetical protein